MSESGRKDLAADLLAAAERAEEVSPELSSSLRQAGEALATELPEDAAPQIEHLAAQLDKMAGIGGPEAGTGSPQAEMRTRQVAKRLPVEAETSPLGLEEGGIDTAPRRTSGHAPPDAGEARLERPPGRRGAGGVIDASPDPLVYPWRLRLAVQRYFARDWTGR
jgi:hypothetical protein